MKLALSEEQEMLRTMARDFLTDKLPKATVKEIEESEKGYSPELWKEMAGLGWMGLAFPEKYGGIGAGFLLFTAIIEEIAKVCASSALILIAQADGMLPILCDGSKALKKRCLPGLAEGKLAAFAATAVLGAILELLGIRSLTRWKRPHYHPMILTLGVAIGGPGISEARTARRRLGRRTNAKRRQIAVGKEAGEGAHPIGRGKKKPVGCRGDFNRVGGKNNLGQRPDCAVDPVLGQVSGDRLALRDWASEENRHPSGRKSLAPHGRGAPEQRPGPSRRRPPARRSVRRPVARSRPAG